VLAVSFEPRERIEAFGVVQRLGVPLWLDLDRCAYRHFGFEAGSARNVWTLAALLRYARALARRERVFAPSGDTHQLGGDVVLDAAGIVRWLRASRGPTDRPTVAEITEALRRAGGAMNLQGEST
jgi:hypothetical protein